jgi:hypothetical protein
MGHQRDDLPLRTALRLAAQWIKLGTSSAHVVDSIMMKMRASAIGLSSAATIATVTFLMSGYAVAGHQALAPVPRATSKSLPESAANPLEGKPLRYLIGTDTSGLGREGEITEVSYRTIKPTARGISVKYCNLFDEENTGRYGPYLHASDTAAQYNEGQIDPAGAGWTRNLQD